MDKDKDDGSERSETNETALSGFALPGNLRTRSQQACQRARQAGLHDGKLVALQNNGMYGRDNMNSVFFGELKSSFPNLCQRFHVDVDATKTTDKFFGI